MNANLVKIVSVKYSGVRKSFDRIYALNIRKSGIDLCYLWVGTNRESFMQYKSLGEYNWKIFFLWHVILYINLFLNLDFLNFGSKFLKDMC